MIRFSKPYSILLLFFGFCCLAAHAQVTEAPYKNYRTKIVRDARLDILLDTLQNRHEANPSIKGYRVQLYMGSERKGAYEVKSELQKNYPGLNAYIIYQPPYFKVRVGDYRTQAEAQPAYHSLLPRFSKAFLVHDDINLPEIN